MRSLRSKDKKNSLKKNESKDEDKADAVPTKSTMTPIKEELISSQQCDPHDTQLEVGWDCNSPDVIRQLRKASKLRKKPNVSEIVSKLIVNKEGEAGNELTHPLLGFLFHKDEPSSSKQAPQTLRDNGKRKLRSRLRHPATKAPSITNELIAVLEKAAGKKDGEDELCSKASTELSSSGIDQDEDVGNPAESPDLFPKLDKYTTPAGTSTPNIHRKTEPLTPIAELHSQSFTVGEKDICNDVSWTDDEFFDDDSLIIKATQVPVDGEQECVQQTKRKSDSPILGNNCKKSKQYIFSLSSSNPTDQNNESVEQNEKINQIEQKQFVIKDCGKVSKASKSCIATNYQQKSFQTKVVNSSPTVSTSTHFKAHLMNCQQSNPKHSKPVQPHSLCDLTTRFKPEDTTKQNSTTGRGWKKYNSFNDSFTNSQTSLHQTENCINKNKWEPSKTSAFRRSNSFTSYNVNTVNNNSSKQLGVVSSISHSTNTSYSMPVYTSSLSSVIQTSCTTSLKTCLSSNQTTVAVCSAPTLNNQKTICGVKGNKSSVSLNRNSHDISSDIKSQNRFTNKPNHRTFRDNSDSTFKKLNKSECIAEKKASSLDTSLTDAILMQLAEPDEILDSQIPFTQDCSEIRKCKGLSSAQTSSSKKAQVSHAQISSSKKEASINKNPEAVKSETMLENDLSEFLGETDVFNNAISATQLQLFTEDDDSFDSQILRTPEFKSSVNMKLSNEQINKNINIDFNKNCMKDHISPTQQPVKQSKSSTCDRVSLKDKLTNKNAVSSNKSQVSQKTKKFVFKPTQNLPNNKVTSPSNMTLMSERDKSKTIGNTTGTNIVTSKTVGNKVPRSLNIAVMSERDKLEKVGNRTGGNIITQKTIDNKATYPSNIAFTSKGGKSEKSGNSTGGNVITQKMTDNKTTHPSNIAVTSKGGTLEIVGKSTDANVITSKTTDNKIAHTSNMTVASKRDKLQIRNNTAANVKISEIEHLKNQSVKNTTLSYKEISNLGGSFSDESDLFPSDDDLLTDVFSEETMFAKLDESQSQAFKVSSTQCSAAEIERKKQEAMKRLQAKSVTSGLSQSTSQLKASVSSRQPVVKR